MPLYLVGVPREEPRLPPVKSADVARVQTQWQRAGDRSALITLAVGLTVASVIMTVISVHGLTLLQTRGLTLAAAASLGALIGPSQVGASSDVEFAGFHRGGCDRLGHAAGTDQHRWSGLILYGSGSGIRSIARGTVPLALFGSDGYALIFKL
jgi:hypothetical protein